MWPLRSSAAADGGRCDVERELAEIHAAVAILGRRGRRPLLPAGATALNA